MGTLWFLWSRQILNGIKRAVSSPRRLIGVLIALGYYVGFFLRPWERSSISSRSKGAVPGKIPGVEKIAAINPFYFELAAFGFFFFMSILLSLSIFSYKNTFKPADVDVLFPTPISSKMVMLFRLFRDYSQTILFPIIFVFFGYNGSTKERLGAVRDADPARFASLIKGSIVAWLLLSLCWVAIGYAISFYTAKHERKSDLITRVLGWSIASVITATLVYVGLALRTSPTLDTFKQIVGSPVFSTIYVIPKAASSIALAGFSGGLIPSILSGVFLLAIIVGCLTFASNLSGWMYDQAATRGFQAQNLREMQRKGDSAAMMGEMARMGKIKTGRLSTKIRDWNFRGGWTLLYKDLLIQSRTGIALTILFVLITSAFAVLFLMIPSKRSEESLGPILYLGITGFMGATMGMAAASNSFSETLKRVEVIKPLPLTSSQIAIFETMSKATVSMFVAAVPFLLGMCIKPSFWQYHLAGFIAGPLLALALVAVVFLVMVLFPDLDDPTQRSFRGLMQMLGMVFAFGPTIAIFVGMHFLKLSPVIPALISGAVNVGITVLAASIAGRFYADFNPSE